jgi:hypothetical protein
VVVEAAAVMVVGVVVGIFVVELIHSYVFLTYSRHTSDFCGFLRICCQSSHTCVYAQVKHVLDIYVLVLDNAS